MKHPRHFFSRCARAASAENCLPIGQDFGLYEQVAEGAMRQIGVQRRQHHFGVTRDFDMPLTGRLVSERNTADLHIVFG